MGVELNEPLFTFLINIANTDAAERKNYFRMIFADIWSTPKGKAEIQRLTKKCKAVLEWSGQLQNIQEKHQQFLENGLHGLPGKFLLLKDTQAAAAKVNQLINILSTVDFTDEHAKEAQAAIDQLKACHNQNCTQDDIKARILELLNEVNSNVFGVKFDFEKHTVANICVLEHIAQLTVDLEELLSQGATLTLENLVSALRGYLQKHIYFLRPNAFYYSTFVDLSKMCGFVIPDLKIQEEKWRKILQYSIVTSVEITDNLEKIKSFVDLKQAVVAVYENIWGNKGEEEQVQQAFTQSIEPFPSYLKWHTKLGEMVNEFSTKIDPDLQPVLDNEIKAQRAFEAELPSRNFQEVNFDEQSDRLQRWNYFNAWQKEAFAQPLTEQVKRYEFLIQKMRRVDPLNAQKETAHLLIANQKSVIVQALINDPKANIPKNDLIDSALTVLEIELRKRELTDHYLKNPKDGKRIAKIVNDDAISLDALQKLFVEFKMERDWAPSSQSNQHQRNGAQLARAFK
jgi:hypothetical protein